MVSHENDDDDAARATQGGVLRARAATRAAYLGNEAPHLDGLVSLGCCARDFTAKHASAALRIGVSRAAAAAIGRLRELPRDAGLGHAAAAAGGVERPSFECPNDSTATSAR